MVNLLVIAGEHSGDNHAACFVRQLKLRHPGINICALGGPALKAAGAHLLFDLTRWSVVGFVEALKHYSRFKTLLTWTVEWVRVHKPKAICLVDFPGFNLLLAERLYKEGLSLKGGGTTCVCEYIAPQIWAWKARRRFKMDRYIDHLGVIFNFEKQYFEDTSLDVQFVGHPLLQEIKPFRYDPNGPILLLPGSRKSAVKRIFPVLKKAFGQLKAIHPELSALVPYPNPAVERILREEADESIQLCPSHTIPCGVRAAIMSSGTASLQVALAGIPGVVTYKANPITFFLGKKLVKVSYLSIANILLKQILYPEFLQDVRDLASVIALHVEAMLSMPELTRQKYVEGARQLLKILSNGQLQDVVDWLENYCV